MAARKGISEAQLMAALKRGGGIFANAAALLDVSRQLVRQRVRASPRLQQFIEDQDAELLDLAELRLLQAIVAGDLATCRWYLDRKGKARGYGRSGLSQPLRQAKIEGHGAGGAAVFAHIKGIDAEL